MALLGLRQYKRSAYQRAAWRANRIVAALTLVAVVGLAGSAYCQTNPSLLQEVIHGGPAGAMLPRPETPVLQGLHITGLLQNTSGMWVDPHGVTVNKVPLRPPTNPIFPPAPLFYPGESATNYLATERTLLQIDTNYDLDSRNHFFLRFWGVYEPQYAFDQSQRSYVAGAVNLRGNREGCFPLGIPGQVGGSRCTASSAADFYNRLEFREAWWRLTLGPLRLFTGRQIVTWGESLAFRIADVVNPQDLSWNLGFANLEQSRIPQWMIHPILELPEMGVFQQNFFEAIFIPAWQPCYNNWVYSGYPTNQDSGQMEGCDSINRGDVNGGRFDIMLQTPYGGPVNTGTANAIFPQSTVGMLTTPPGQFIHFRYPGTAFFSDSSWGMRLHSLIDQTWETTMLFWHGHQFFPAVGLQRTPGFFGKRGPDGLPYLQLLLFNPQLNDIGLTMNRPLNLPGHLGDLLPFVLRTEGVWQDHTPFTTRNPGAESGIKYSGTANTLVALDLDQIYAPWLTSTGGSLTMNFEWNNYTILSPSRYMEYSSGWEPQRHNEESFIVAASTSWWWQSIAPQWVMVFNPDGNTFLLFPNVVLTPPWTSQYFLKFQYIGILNNNQMDDYSAGLLKGRNFVIMQFQWNFNLL